MALIDGPYHKSSHELIEFVLYGETLEEREQRNEMLLTKKHIIALYENGLAEKDIAKSFKLELSFVRSVIEENAAENTEE